ncbi:MAG TPA: hypothetical protein PK823_16550 [Novosphingobium sp.]|nr:hypothetical protein [Novosphingobium sp.]
MTLTRQQIRAGFEAQEAKAVTNASVIAERIDLRNQRFHRLNARNEFAINAIRANFDDHSLKQVFGLSATDIKRLRIRARQAV